ncbi:MAG: heparan-alpha-glucosaminide N-acetyltransferase [Bacillota bacterium]
MGYAKCWSAWRMVYWRTVLTGPFTGGNRIRIVKGQRFGEVDALRGAAVIMMVIYHLAWDLNYFGYYRESVTTGGWYWFQQVILTGFVFTAGVALWLSYSVHGRIRFAQYLDRGLKILGWAFAITLVTHFALREGTVLFGVLHLIGLSVICAYPLLRFGRGNLVFGLAFILLGSFLARVPVDYPCLGWLGLRPVELYMLDFVPVFPWFGVVLLGIGTGGLLYPGGARFAGVTDFSSRQPLQLLALLGRNSLFIYLIHQPVLFGLLFLWRFVAGIVPVLLLG